MIILRILTFIYGALTLLAVGEEITKTQFNSLHVVYIALSLALVYVAIQREPTWLLYIGLLGLIAFAILGGPFKQQPPVVTYCSKDYYIGDNDCFVELLGISSQNLIALNHNCQYRKSEAWD